MVLLGEFEKIFQSAVTDGICNTLGRPVMETLLGLLKQPFQTYAEKPKELHHDLSRIFGSAAGTLEKMISKELFQKLNLRYPGGNELEFETCVHLARQDMMLNRRGIIGK